MPERSRRPSRSTLTASTLPRSPLVFGSPPSSGTACTETRSPRRGAHIIWRLSTAPTACTRPRSLVLVGLPVSRCNGLLPLNRHRIQLSSLRPSRLRRKDSMEGDVGLVVTFAIEEGQRGVEPLYVGKQRRTIRLSYNLQTLPSSFMTESPLLKPWSATNGALGALTTRSSITPL